MRGRWRFQPPGALLLAVVIAATGLSGCLNRLDLFDTATTPEISVRQGDTFLPSGAGMGNFGPVKVRDSKSLVFTVENKGAVPLNITGIAISSGDADQFVLDLVSMSSVVKGGGETSFTLTYSPTRTGASAATVRIESDDPDARLYTFGVAGTGEPATLIVTQGGTTLQNGSSTFTFDPVTSGYTGASVQFTLENAGENTVDVSSICLDGGDAADFQLSAPTMPRSLLQGETLSFAAAFAPRSGSTGTLSTEVLIASDAEGETSYRFTLRGTALTPTPEITVTQGGTEYPDGSTFDGFGNVTVGESGAPVTFTVTNDGTARLTLSTINSSNLAEFNTVLTGTDFTLDPSQSTDFTVTFRPSAAGARSSGLEITSDDGDESVYTIALSGYGTPEPAPEINLKRYTTNIASGQQGWNFGSVLTGSTSSAVTFTIENIGNAALTVTGIASSLPEFTLSAPAVPFTVAAGSTRTFTLAFAPSVAGTVTTTVTIANDDDNESSYTFTAPGTGLTPTPSIKVRKGTTEIADGTTLGNDFGTVYLGETSQPVAFTIDNTAGTAPLIISDLYCDGADFIIDYTGFTSSIPAGGTTLFRMSFSPASTGTKTATVWISNNDPATGKNPYTFTVRGTGAAAPDVVMSVWADGQKRPSGGTLSFGQVTIGTSLAMTFTVLNEGPENLVLNYILRTDGSTLDFSVDITGTVMGAPIAASGSTTFIVTFTPSTTLTVWRDLEIGGNAADSPFVIRLEGSGSEDD